MKKKIVIFVILAVIIVCYIYITNNINKKASILFGDDYCPKKSDDYSYEDYEHSMIAGMALTDYKCELCNRKYTHSNTATPKICPKCAATTNRCSDCGKLEHKN